MRKSKIASPVAVASKTSAPVSATARKDKTFLARVAAAVAFLADVRLFAAELILLMLILVIGTLAQASMGLYAAQTMFFDSWYWLAGGFVPMPGMRLVLGFILVGLVLRLAKEPLTLKRVPVWLVHAGVVLLLAGGFLANFKHTEGYILVAEGETSNILYQAPGGDTDAPPSLWKAATTLPFSITLHTFTRTLHPGTDMASQYQSDVILKDADGRLSPAAIAMNQPLRHNGWAVYQASYWQDKQGREVSVLAVVQNKGRILPYLSGLVVALGMLGVVVQRLGVLRRLLVLLVLATAAWNPAQALAQPQPEGPMPMEAFASIPVLHNGRVKPMDTFARDVALRLTGTDTPASLPAVVWMADLVFQPASLAGQPLIKVADPGTAGLLGLPWRTPHLYTLEELIPALQKQSELVMQLVAAEEAGADKRTKVKGQEAELLAVYRRVQEVVTLGRTFSLVFPLFVVRDETLAAQLGVQAGAPFDYMTLMTARPKYLPLLEAIPHKKEGQLTALDKDVLNLALRARMMADDRTSALFRVLPPLWTSSRGEWVAPWPSYTSGLGGPQHLAALQLWKEALQAWQANRGVAFAHATQLLAQPPKGLEAVWPPRWKLQLELLMNRFQPFAMAMGLCLLAAVGTAAATWRRARPVLLPLASAAAVLGLFTLGGGIAARILILGRPPVATLYESVLFVAVTTLAVGLSVALVRRDSGLLGLISLLGAGLLGVAHWQAGQGDTLGMLIAVLNTNFWLTTHVLSITGGYGLCLLLAGTAHVLLLRQAWALWRRQKSLFTKAQEQAVLVLTVLALLTTALGTVLGGVWADQSWGRFWGWDPKENGALLIVLWLTMLLHLRLAGWLKFPLFLVGSGATTIVVALSWFGVNLLSVGLHSYGFTSGMAEGLGLFVLGQVAVLTALAWLTVRKER